MQGVEYAMNVPGAKVFHAGTKLLNGNLVTSGGRVLAVTGVGPSIACAKRVAYDAAQRIDFEGKQYRKDIANRFDQGYILRVKQT